MCPYQYYQIMKNCKDKKSLRLQLIQSATTHGIKPTARMFETSPQTVRKWLRRFNENGLIGLEELSRKPLHSPNKIPQKTKDYIISLKNKYKNIGAKEIRTLENLKQSEKTIIKIFKEAGIPSRIRRKKHVTKNNLRHVKKNLKLFELSMEDTKDLIDIPEYLAQIKAHNLPKVQYSFREVSTGILFTGFSNNRSLTHSHLFATYINHFLTKFNALPKTSYRQTDNGSEYIGSWNAKNPSAYTLAIESIDGHYHTRIKPGAHRMQADVETIHNLMEFQFYEVETFNSREDFMNKITAYQLFFNLHRPNSYKENKTPCELANEKNPNLDQHLLMVPPVDLDKLLDWTHSIKKRGNNVLTAP